jgi:mannose-6-phosphate isomerase class I
MNIRKYRWSKDYESAEEELLQLFIARGITASIWQIEPFQKISHSAQKHKLRIWCAEGSLNVFADNKNYSLQPGDTLEIAQDFAFEITAGIAGFVCYQTVV